MKFNICIVKTDSWDTDPYRETAELIHFSIQALGHQSQVNNNFIDASAKNIVFGYVYIDVNSIENLPPNSVIFNTEPIYDDNIPSFKLQKLLQFASLYEIWDYSDINFELLTKLGVTNKKIFKFGYQKELSRIPKSTLQDIDVLFYGSMNNKRLVLLKALEQEGCNVQYLCDCYGKNRDEFIARSKIVVHAYYYNTKTFDIIRFFYLMSNAKAIVTEVDENFPMPEEYKNGIYGSPYEKIVQSCLSLIQDEAKRSELEKNALLTLQKIPQTTLTKKLLALESDHP